MNLILNGNDMGKIISHIDTKKISIYYIKDGFSVNIMNKLISRRELQYDSVFIWMEGAENNDAH